MPPTFRATAWARPGIDIGHADVGTPVGQKAGQRRPDVPGPLHGDPHAREVAAHGVADGGGNGVEHAQGGRR